MAGLVGVAVLTAPVFPQFARLVPLCRPYGIVRWNCLSRHLPVFRIIIRAIPGRKGLVELSHAGLRHTVSRGRGGGRCCRRSGRVLGKQCHRRRARDNQGGREAACNRLPHDLLPRILRPSARESGATLIAAPDAHPVSKGAARLCRRPLEDLCVPLVYLRVPTHPAVVGVPLHFSHESSFCKTVSTRTSFRDAGFSTQYFSTYRESHRFSRGEAGR